MGLHVRRLLELPKIIAAKSPATARGSDGALRFCAMRLWRLTRSGHTALDGSGTLKHGGRYSLPGIPVVNFTSEAALAVLVALRYLPAQPADAPDDFVLGWTEVVASPERISEAGGDDAIRGRVADWLAERRTLLATVSSQVLPEADIVLMNPLHADAVHVPPLVTRPFSFAECLHTPPMLSRYSSETEPKSAH
jgi:RES domain-containing protein